MSALTVRLESLLDATFAGLGDQLVMREDCAFCKASGTGWCEPCRVLDEMQEAIGQAVTRVQNAVSDTAAAGVYLDAVTRVAGLPESAPVLVLTGMVAR